MITTNVQIYLKKTAEFPLPIERFIYTKKTFPFETHNIYKSIEA